jgi:hypothetical protein
MVNLLLELGIDVAKLKLDCALRFANGKGALKTQVQHF